MPQELYGDLRKLKESERNVMDVEREVKVKLTPMILPPLSPEPLVSILMANRNYEAYINAAIASVLDQTYRNLELVICDDASEDGSVQIVWDRMRHDPRIKLLVRDVPGGQGTAFNAVFAMSCGSIICFLDSDDTYGPTKIERIVQHFQEYPSVGIITHPLKVVDSKGYPLGLMPFRTRLEHGWIGEKVIRRGGRWTSMPYGGTCLRREVAERIFPVPREVMTLFSDSYVSTIASLLSEVSSIPDPLYDYRIHGRNVMQSILRDETVSQLEVEGMRLQVSGTNRRLRELALAEAELELEHNLNYRQQTYLLSLFQGHNRVKLTREYISLMRLLLTDDLYHLRERLIRICIYGVAIPLPLPVRRWWLLASRSPHRFIRLMKKRLRL